METMMRPASPPVSRQDFRLDSAATSPYATAPSSPHGRLAAAAGSDSPFGSAEAPMAGSPFLTAPPSPNPFDLLPPATPRLAGANPFDLFQHFSSAPASPRRAAAIYAHLADANRGGGEDGEEEDDEGFQQRSSYSTTGASAVPFDWEERPGTPKAGMGGGAAAWEDTDFEFGTVADKTAPAESLTTADELFEKGRIRPLKPLPPLKTAADELSDKGKIRPLKPPPGLLDGGSVGSSPRSPMAKGAMRSPRRRSRVGSGTDFDPFAAALLEATKAPSPLGGKHSSNNNSGVASGSPPKKADLFAARPASKSAGWRKWRLSDLLLFRSSSEGGRINKDSFSNCSPAPGAPTAKTTPPPAMVKIGSMDKLHRKQSGDKSAAAAAEGIVGCARLSPLQRLARGLGGHSWHHGRGVAAPGIKG
uniref:Uncharacterized protein n=1 Tax=Avena sativa TaxID=4498 RepID=A0ACD5ZR16_AVESA